ncbi:hypothetical protein Adt_00029 [Abeliophyllum distichum]|uniref:Uncharacterized protein n=1 Tax=Abeliophyllum distichum TaxID=126358 RepID=A0ABD1VNX7_9LAMI
MDECRVPVGEALEGCRVPVGEAMDECRVPVGEALEGCRVPVGEALNGGIGGDSIGCGGGDAPFHVLPVLEGVLPIRGIDGSTGEAIPMGTTSGLREASDPYRADVVRWAAMDVPSIMKEEDPDEAEGGV